MTEGTNDFSRRGFIAASVSALSYSRILGANDRANIGIIGCGGRGLLKEVLQFRKETNCEISAICDTWNQQRDTAVAAIREASGTAPEQFVRYQDLLALKSVDAVVIGTPDHQHCTQLTAAVRAGKDAYVEKPLAMDMKELLLAVDTVKKSNRIVQCGTQIRSYPHSVAARQFVTSGNLGKILKVEQSRNAYKPYWHQFGTRQVTEKDVDWKGFLMQRKYRAFDKDQYAAWYGYRDFSRGPHSNLMVHFIDLVHYVTGCKPPSRVVTLGGIYRWKDSRNAPDSVETILEYPEGFLVRYNTTFGSGANNSFKFIGTRGVIDAAKWNWKESWVVSGEGSGEPDKIKAGETIPVVESTPHMKNWMECLRTRKQPNAPIEAGYAHSVAVIMADDALVRGRRMVYNPAKRAIHEG
jgi:predicted dehydrogenase